MRSWDDVVVFPKEKVRLMREIIRRKREGFRNQGLVFNTVLREDIFDLLNACCTVVFYPFLQDENDGFQVARPVTYGGGPHIEQFVYLNTAKALEKQVFAVGHELGHIWEVADQLWDEALEQVLPRAKNEEAAMNRFAAELLMPEEEFRTLANGRLETCRKKGPLTYQNCIHITADLMNEFCVPATSVILRFYETGCLSDAACNRLLFDGPKKEKRDEYQKQFQKVLESYIRESGYTRLLSPTHKKGIRDFPQILREAEDRGVFSPEKAAALRAELGIPKPEIDTEETGLDEVGLE